MASLKASFCFMELRIDCMKLLAFLCFCIATTSLFTECEARVSKHFPKHHGAPEHLSNSRGKISKTIDRIKSMKRLEMDNPAPVLSNTQPYVSSPFSLPPFDSLAPMPLPENTPPFCEYPPSTPQPPSSIIPTPITYSTPPPPAETSYSTPILPIQNPPPSPTFDVPSPPESSPISNPPEYGPSPPSFAPGTPEYGPSPPSFAPGTPEYVPSPPNPPFLVPGTPQYGTSPPSPAYLVPGTPEYVPSPDYYVPGPPETVPGTPGFGNNPPTYIPSPSGYTPSPTVFQPPVIYPPPSVPPPPYRATRFALWCVVKPTVPDPIIQEAMNYACGSGADCGSIQQNGSCYKPDTLSSHASYAFNSYWQRTKAAGGTCDFGGTGMLVTVDPSFDGCHFIHY